MGIAANGLSVTTRMRSMTLRTVAGPELQLHPTASAPHSVNFSAAVSAEDREARNVGINGVPFFIFNGSTALSGAHDPETLLQAIAAARSQST